MLHSGRAQELAIVTATPVQVEQAEARELARRDVDIGLVVAGASVHDEAVPGVEGRPGPARVVYPDRIGDPALEQRRDRLARDARVSAWASWFMAESSRRTSIRACPRASAPQASRRDMRPAPGKRTTATRPPRQYDFGGLRLTSGAQGGLGGVPTRVPVVVEKLTLTGRDRASRGSGPVEREAVRCPPRQGLTECRI